MKKRLLSIICLIVLIGISLPPTAIASVTDSIEPVKVTQVGQISITEPLDRHYYLSTWTGDGLTEETQFRPLISKFTNTYAVIDLRPDSSKVDGYCICYADGDLIKADGITYLADTIATADKAVQSTIASLTNINVMPTSDTLPDFLFKYLVVNDPDKCPPLRPDFDGQYRISLGQQIFGEPRPETVHHTITDDFNRASVGSDWTVISGSWSIYSSTQLSSDTNSWVVSLRYDASALGSEDCYAQVDFTYGSSTSRMLGPCVEFASDAETFYRGCDRTGGDPEHRFINKVVNGSASVLANEDGAGPATIKLEHNGSTLNLYIDGVLELTTTDTSITGNTNVGVSGKGSTARGDNFEADVLGGGAIAPTVTNSTGASSVTYNSARLNGELTDDGGATTNITVYWGDNDGDTTPGNWDNAEALGEEGEGTFYYDASGLDSETQYFYRCYALNSEGDDWADSTANFTTTAAPYAPTITNSTGASSITDTTARLNCELTDDGNDSTNITICWGNDDAETTLGNWDHQEALGVQTEGTYYYDASGLDPETPYFYRAYAVNGEGSDWADSTANFTTEAEPVVSEKPVALLGNVYPDNSYSESAGVLTGTRVQNTYGAGNITQISLYINTDTPTALLHLGIYSDDGGSPDALLLDAGEVRANHGWTTIRGLSFATTNETYYWLTFLVDGSTPLYYNSGGPSNCHAYESGVSYGALPASFNPDGQNDSYICITAVMEADSSWDGPYLEDFEAGDSPDTDSAYHAIENPPGVESGDTLVAVFSVDGSINCTAYPGFGRLAPLPYPAADVPGITDGTYIYYIGGYGDDDTDLLDYNQRYDPSTNTWSQMATMTTPRWGAAAAYYDGNIYVFGGSASGGASNKCEIYNITGDNWTTGTNMPSSFDNGIMAVTVTDYIYLFRSTDVIRFDPSGNGGLGSYTTGLESATVAKQWGACAYVVVGSEKRIYIIGGSDDSGNPSNTNYYYRPDYDDWSSAQTACPYTAHGMLRDDPTDGTYIWVGFGWNKDTSAFYGDLYRYDPSTDTWSDPKARSYRWRDGVGCAILSGSLYVAGGREVTGSPYGIAYNEVFDTSESNNWTRLGQDSYSTTATSAVFYKEADGLDGLTVSTNASEQSSFIVYLIKNGGLVYGSSANGSSTNSNPPELDTGASDSYLWLASRGSDAQVVASAAPSGYSMMSVAFARGASGASTNLAWYQYEAQTDDPGTFTSATEQWISWTVAVAPAVAAPAISISVGSKSFGVLLHDSTNWSNGSEPSWPLGDGDCYTSITNSGGASGAVTVKATDFTGTGATLYLTDGAPDATHVRLSVFKAGDGSTDNVTIITTDRTFLPSMASGNTTYIEFKLEWLSDYAPDQYEKTCVVTFTISP